MILIGVSGKKGRGKDTFFRECSKMLKVSYCQLAFADALYEEVATATSCDINYIREHKDIFRPILQWWGTDFRRELTSNNYWVTALLQKLVKLDNAIKIVFITDVRFANEAKVIRDAHGYLVRINGLYHGLEGEPEKHTDHPSETSLDGFDFNYTIDNSGSLDLFNSRCFDFLRAINKHQTESEKII